MNNRKVYIYGIYTDKDDTIMYVGKTVININSRLREHINESKNKNSSKKHKWINKCILDNDEIKVKLLEICNVKNWSEKEIFWIDKLHNENKHLTNSSIGGELTIDFICKYTYEECEKFARLNKIKSFTHWYKFIKYNAPIGMPKCPYKYYSEFETWGKFLGTGTLKSTEIAKNFTTYEKCKKWVNDNLSVKSKKEWFALNRVDNLPIFIPKAPYNFYKNNGWISWCEFLNTNNVRRDSSKFVNYEKCKEFTKNNSIKTKSEWYIFINNNNIPNNIPKSPNNFYKRTNEWVNWYDFLNKEIPNQYT